MTSTPLPSEMVSNFSHLDEATALASNKPASSDPSELNSLVFDHSDQDALRDPHPWATRIDRFTGLPMYPPYFRNPPSPTTTTAESVTTASESSIESIDEVRLPPVVAMAGSSTVRRCVPPSSGVFQSLTFLAGLRLKTSNELKNTSGITSGVTVVSTRVLRRSCRHHRGRPPTVVWSRMLQQNHP